VWRDVLLEITNEEGRRLCTPPAIIEEATRVIRASADSSLVRIAGAYDAQLRVMNTELARADRFKSEFLAKMSHQLRTPLTAILGFCEVLLGGMDGPLTDEQQQDIGLVNQSGQVLLELVNDILDLSKIEAGKIEVATREVRVGDVAEKVIASLDRLAEAKAVVLTKEITPDGLTVMADPVHVREILTNLVANAIKFTPRGSVTVHAAVTGKVAEISVIDTGIGIPSDAQERIFEEFSQANDEISKQYGGTGLGLPIARRLVELQGGRMGVSSEPGKGSRFWFTLPMSAAA
jgi:signal transduction histidine kinase